MRTLLLVVFCIALLLHLPPRLDAAENFVRFPLGPNKVVSFPLIIVSHGPPEARFEGSPYNARVVATTYVVFIWLERRSWELDLLHSIGLQDLYQEFTVIFFFQLQISLFIFRIRQILRQLLDFLGKILETAEVRRLWFVLLRWLLIIERLAIRTILHDLAVLGSIIGSLSLRLFCIMIFLEVLFSHLALNNH